LENLKIMEPKVIKFEPFKNHIIDVRGTKTSLQFRVLHLSDAFGILNLQQLLMSDKSFIKNVDYKIIMQNQKRLLYITHEGVKKLEINQQLKTEFESWIDMNVNTKVNKGTGAGGFMTNVNGLSFEKKTSNEKNLIELGFKKNEFLTLTKDDVDIVFVKQNEFKKFVQKRFQIKTTIKPDECYIFLYKTGDVVFKIIEMKNQNCEGSVFQKLYAGPSFKREYEILFPKVKIEYNYCVNNFLKKKLEEPKQFVLNQIFQENNIKVFFGDDEDYFTKLNQYLQLK